MMKANQLNITGSEVRANTLGMNKWKKEKGDSGKEIEITKEQMEILYLKKAITEIKLLVELSRGWRGWQKIDLKDEVNGSYTFCQRKISKEIHQSTSVEQIIHIYVSWNLKRKRSCAKIIWWNNAQKLPNFGERHNLTGSEINELKMKLKELSPKHDKIKQTGQKFWEDRKK